MKRLKRLDLSGIPNRIVNYNTNDAFNLATEQEIFVVDRLREAYSEYHWYRTVEFFKIMDTEENRVLGDIVGIKVGEDIPCCWMDLKVTYPKADTPHRLGTIALSSIFGFAKDSVNHYYLSVNRDGTEFCLKTGKEIYDLYKRKKCLLKSTNPKRKPNPELDFLKDKYIKGTDNVSTYDYMPSFIFYEKYV